MGARWLLSPLRDPVALTVGGLAVHRLTRLLIEDEITQPLRDWIDPPSEEPIQEQTRLGYFITCPWCVSVWVAAGWAVLTAACPGVTAAAGAALAWSSVTGLLSSVE
jgi:hypothetical protein